MIEGRLHDEKVRVKSFFRLVVEARVDQMLDSSSGDDLVTKH